MDNTQISTVKQSPYSHRTTLIHKASQRLPLTAEGLPVGFYRVDLIPNVPSQGIEDDIQSLRNAYTELSFEHGYPTLSDGRPFWAKLDFEPSFAYGAFQIFLEQPDISDAPRDIQQLSYNEELLQLHHAYQTIYGRSPNDGTNSKSVGNGTGIDDPADSPDVSSDVHLGDPGRTSHGETKAIANAETQVLSHTRALGRTLTEFSILYNWRARSKAYDLYKEASYRHSRLRRQNTSEEGHYKLAVQLLKNLQEKVLNTPRFWDDMAPKTAVDLLAKLVAIQRVSVGLPAAGPLMAKDQSPDMTFEMIMRTLGQKAGEANRGRTFDQEGVTTGREAVAQVLEDREATQMLQEVVIRVTKATQGHGNSDDITHARRFKGRGRAEPIAHEELQPYDVTGAPGEST